MRVAHAKGMLLGEYLERVTHLEHLMWCEWLVRQWNEPDRHDWYAMAVRAEVKQARLCQTEKRPPSVQVEQMKLKFKTGREQLQEQEERQPDDDPD